LEWLRSDGQALPLDEVRGEAAAFCGIGHPATFRTTLESIGMTVREFRAYPDHHRYDMATVEALEKWARRLPPEWPILTTQKDLVKLRCTRLAEHELLALRIGLHIQKGEVALRHLLTNVVPQRAQLST